LSEVHFRIVSKRVRSSATNAKNSPYDCPSEVLLRSNVRSMTRPSACTKRPTKSSQSGHRFAASARSDPDTSVHAKNRPGIKVLRRIGYIFLVAQTVARRRRTR